MNVRDDSVTSQIETAVAPARWLLAAGAEGIPLTQTHALARSVVRDAAERWPQWWNAELFGPPHREADLPVLNALHEGLRRLRLLRRRGRRLLPTARGCQLAEDPSALLGVLAPDVGAGDPFTDAVASAVVGALRAHDRREHDALAAAAGQRIAREAWRDAHGVAPSPLVVSAVVGDVLRRCEAYGLIERHSDDAEPYLHGRGIALSAAGRLAFAGPATPSKLGEVLVFDAELMNVRGVRASLAVCDDQHLTALHGVIQMAFGWYDDHLYSFWLDGAFWGDEQHEFTSPLVADQGVATADVPLAELDLRVGRRIAYVFDFGDEWRVSLALQRTESADGGSYPRVLQRTGDAPPQYPALDEA